MNKICLIRQPAGIGDIMFCLKIAQHYKDMGYDIIWPVIPEFKWVEDYIKGINFPFISEEFCKKDIYYTRYPIITEDFVFLPLQDADQHHPNLLIMDSKYKLAGITYEGWREHLKIVRNEAKENELYSLMNTTNEPYIFINKNYGSPPGYRTIDYIPSFPIKVIEMTFNSKYGLFDWMKILENAQEIHIVDTALSYIIEVTQSIKCPLYLYSRYNPHNFNQTKHLYSRNWNYVL